MIQVNQVVWTSEVEKPGDVDLVDLVGVYLGDPAATTRRVVGALDSLRPNCFEFTSAIHGSGFRRRTAWSSSHDRLA